MSLPLLLVSLNQKTTQSAIYTLTQATLQITGATGFVGSHVLHQALEAGYPVRV